VKERSFLVSVNGFPLDRFGMGLNPEYAADRVHYEDLFWMVPTFSSGAEFETCFEGKTTKHKVSMDWKPAYGRGLQWISEPNMAAEHKDFEMFGDISVMQMTSNHVYSIMRKGSPGVSRWLHPDLVATPRLAVNYVRSGSYASKILAIGASVTKVNGHEVQTMQDFRDHFVPADGQKVWTMETDLGKVVALMFDKSLKEQLHRAETANAPYLLTPSVVEAAERLGLSEKTSAKVRQQTSANVKVSKVSVQSKVAKKHAFLSSSSTLAAAAAKLPMRAAGPLEAYKLEESAPGRSTYLDTERLAVSADGAILTLSA